MNHKSVPVMVQIKAVQDVVERKISVLPFLRLVSILAYTSDVFATESVTVVRGKR